jgi:hypothetical protein
MEEGNDKTKNTLEESIFLKLTEATDIMARLANKKQREICY